MNKSHPIHINIPISKIDEEQRMVWGYATVEEIDAHGEIIGYEASKAAFPNWLGNIREMHGPTAIGKSIEIEFDDENKGVWLGSYISESADGENAWIKVKEGILQAYSIGGTINDYTTVKGVDGKNHTMITDYDLYEVSLVDNPACPSATLQVVKSVEGKLERQENLSKGFGIQPPWWMGKFNFSPSQQVIKSAPPSYNKDSMTEKSKALAKSIWDAYDLVDLAACLSGYIWMQAYEGKNIDDLKAALETIQAAAAEEISEPVDFPEVVEIAIENACKALNITKIEELHKMADTKKSIEKSGAAVIDSDPRDDKAATVAEAVPTAAVKPAAAKVPKAVYAADGKTVTNKAADGEPAVTEPDEPEAPAEDEPTTEPTTEPVATPAETPIEESASQSDLVKAMLAGVEGLIEKAVKPLNDEIAILKGAPAPNKKAVSYVDVDKVEKRKEEEAEAKTKMDELLAKATELAADPTKGTLMERTQLALQLRKQSRLMDPESRQTAAQVRASFQQ